MLAYCLIYHDLWDMLPIILLVGLFYVCLWLVICLVYAVRHAPGVAVRGGEMDGWEGSRDEEVDGEYVFDAFFLDSKSLGWLCDA